jgi:hypothetical protein
MRMKKIPFLSILISIFLISNFVSAGITLGSIVDINSLTIEKGEIGRFKASFFNLGDKPIKVEFHVEYSKELRVEIDPEELILYSGDITSAPDCSDTEECEWFILRDGRTYARVYPIYIYVKIPSEVSKNFYKIKLTAIASDLEKSDEGGIRQNLAQVREIILTAYVPGRTKESEKIEFDYDDEEERLKSLKEAYKKMIYERSIRSEREIAKDSDDETKNIKKEGEDKMSTTVEEESKGGGKEKDSKLVGVTREEDEVEKTKIKLPVGEITMSKEQTEKAVDVGIVALLISIISLVVRILK